MNKQRIRMQYLFGWKDGAVGEAIQSNDPHYMEGYRVGQSDSKDALKNADEYAESQVITA